MNRLIAPALLGLLVSCADRPVGIRVGAKDFAEQAILSEMVVQLLRHRGWAGATAVPCGDTYACHRDLQRGAIDVLVEYTGTGLAFLGEARAAADSSLATARQLYAPFGLTWLGPLGFDNGYRLLVPSERASVQGLHAITDLARLEGGFRITCPPEYLRRPQDGLAALLQRYGLRLAGQPVVLADPGQRFQALFDGRAEVAVGYATDGAIASLGLRELRDPLRFFPPYEAVVVARTELLRRDRRLEPALRQLDRRLDTSTMRQLNYRVQVEGVQPAAVARRFLLDRKLIARRSPGRRYDPALVLAVHRHDRLDQVVIRAIRAVRQVFPGRAVTTLPSSDPAQEVARGRARLAILGAERFFTQVGGGPPVREQRVEAIAVLATRVVHLVRRAGEPPSTHPLDGRIGLGERGSGASLVTEGVIAVADRPAAARSSPAKLLAQVGAGRLDAALVLAEPGDATLAGAIAKSKLVLRPLVQDEVGGARSWLSPEQAVRQPYLRPARIPAGTYVAQPEPIETLGAQVVLAGPAADGAALAPAGGGPAAALPVGGRPFAQAEVEALARATRVAEAPDPILPSAWTLRPRTAGATPGSQSILLDTLLNVLAIGFLVWLVGLVLRRRRALP